MNSDLDSNRFISPKPKTEDQEFDSSLRPLNFDDFIGQEKLKDNLKIFVEAAKKRKESLDHILFSGPPGLGKTTLAQILANELGVGIHITSGPVLEKKGDLAGNLTNLAQRDIFFVDEIHRLNRIVEESLYPAMEDFVFDIMTGEGPAARAIRIPLNKFTLVGATTRAGLITSPMLARFGYVGRLSYYAPEELKTIALRTSQFFQIECTDEAAFELGRRARGTPRVVNRLVRRARDVAQVKGKGIISIDIVTMTLSMLGIDDYGFDEMDRMILSTIIQHYNGGPVGINNIAVVVGEEPDTIEDVYEPYLIQAGFLKRTPRGRMVTHHAYNYFKIAMPAVKEAGASPPIQEQTDLFNSKPMAGV
ncbi:MAG: Holliday junction branch migration DNA helicase RuvB [Chitinivibrionales bacterium]|nr:Holliday junction branch migration DNA helicase RuvB [Chitinivibrionales bacterium]